MEHGIPKWLVTLSMAANKVLCGPCGYSLCARFWEGRIEGKRLHTALVWISDMIFWFDPQHCRKAWLLRRKDI